MFFTKFHIPQQHVLLLLLAHLAQSAGELLGCPKQGFFYCKVIKTFFEGIN
jgi:hypothetical protein